MILFPDTIVIDNPKLESLFDRLEHRNGKPFDRKGMIGDLMLGAKMTQEEAESEAIVILEMELT